MSNELIFYKTPDGEQRIDVVYQNENFWMTQKTVSELFCVKVPAISKHLKNIFDTDELSEIRAWGLYLVCTIKKVGVRCLFVLLFVDMKVLHRQNSNTVQYSDYTVHTL